MNMFKTHYYCLHFNKAMPCLSTVITTSGGMFELACRTIIHIYQKRGYNMKAFSLGLILGSYIY